MEEFNNQETIRVKYDLSRIKTGESVFSKNNEGTGVCLCIKNSDTSWTIYEYPDKTKCYKHQTDDPGYYIKYNNKVFDIDKTKWVQEYFDKTIKSQQWISQFEEKLKHNFIW